MVGYVVAVAEATRGSRVFQTCHSERRAKNLNLKRDANLRFCKNLSVRSFVGLRMTHLIFFLNDGLLTHRLPITPEHSIADEKHLLWLIESCCQRGSVGQIVLD